MPTTPTLSPGQNILTLVGRILVALLFVPAGWAKLTGFGGAVGYIGSVGLPLPAVGAVLAIVVELGLGLLLLAGFYTRIAAAVLALFSVVAALFFHAYWSAPEGMVMMQQINFYKNLAIAGGLLGFVAFGAGGFSVDAKRAAA